MKAIIILILSGVLVCYAFILHELITAPKHDYKIDLQQDSIRVIDEYHDTTIHFDDLEEYLIRDNL